MKTPSNSTRNNAKNLIKILGITQKVIANDIKRTPSVINGIFSSGNIADGVSDQIIKQVLAAIHKRIKEKEKIETDIDFHQVKNLFEGVSADLVDNYIAVSPPGTPITSSKAANNISSASDEALLNYTSNNIANLVFIDGGIKSGRTSSLKKIVSHSDEATIHTVLIDFTKIKNEDCVLSFLCAGIIEDYYSDELNSELLIKNKSHTPEHHQNSMTTFFTDKFKTASLKKINLLLDNIDHLQLEGQEEQEILLSWLMELSERFAGKITIFIVFSGNGWSSTTRSSIKSRGMTVLLQPFTINQVEQLIHAYSGEKDHAEEIYHYSLGQPYITHVIIDAMSLGTDLKMLINLQNYLQGNLLNHWEVVKSELRKEYATRLNILIEVLEIINQSTLEEKIDISNVHGITADLAGPLFSKFCMLNGDPRVATVSGFFRHALQSDVFWINELEDSRHE